MSTNFSRFSKQAQKFVQQTRNWFARLGVEEDGIQVKDLSVPENPEALPYKDVLNGNIRSNFHSNGTGTKGILLSLESLYNQHRNLKEAVYEDIEKIRNRSTAKAIRAVIKNKGFGSFFDTGYFNVGYSLPEELVQKVGRGFEKKVDKIIKDCAIRLNIKNKIKNNMDDFLDHGELVFIIDEAQPGVGITKLNTDIEGKDFVPFELNDEPVFGMYRTDYEDSRQKNSYKLISADNFFYFALNAAQQKIKFSDFYNSDIRDKFQADTGLELGKYIYAGEGVYACATKLIEKLELLEGLETGLLAGDALQSEVEQIAVPEQWSAEEARETAQEYEIKLNDFTHANDLDLSDVNSLISATHNVQVIPSWKDGKGGLAKYQLSNSDISTRISDATEKLRNMISILTGCDPYTLGTHTDLDKGQLLRFDSRFSNLILSIASCISTQLKRLFQKECELHGYYISTEYIKADFCEINAFEALNKLDIMVSAITSYSEFVKLSEELSRIGIGVNRQEFVTLLEKELSKFIDCNNLFRLEAIADDNEKDGFSPLG